MALNHEIQFGIGLDTDVVQVDELLAHAHFADDAGLDIVSLTDHPYFAERIDAYAAWPSCWARYFASPAHGMSLAVEAISRRLAFTR
jgi:hypothetical protein